MTDVHHVLTPGDHFSPRTGSAIPTVVHGLASGARAAGDDARYPQRVVLQTGTFEPRYASALPEEYTGVPAPGRVQRIADVARGRIGLPRRGAERYFEPAVARLRAEPPGIVLAHNAVIVPWLLRATPHVSVLYAHNDVLRSYSPREAARIAGAATRIVSVSESLAAQLRRSLPRSLHERVRVVCNGVDAATFTPAPRERVGSPRVMFLGRTIPDKGADVLLDAAVRLARSDVEYVIVGSHGFDAHAALSPYEKRLRALAARVPAPVRFEPFVPRVALPDLLRTADMLVLPSRWAEPWALTVGEGLATGLPVIASCRGGIPESLGDAGVLFDPDRPGELAAAIASLLDDAPRRRALGERARRSAVARDWTWAWSHLARVLDELTVAGA